MPMRSASLNLDEITAQELELLAGFQLAVLQALDQFAGQQHAPFGERQWIGSKVATRDFRIHAFDIAQAGINVVGEGQQGLLGA